MFEWMHQTRRLPYFAKMRVYVLIFRAAVVQFFGPTTPRGGANSFTLT